MPDPAQPAPINPQTFLCIRCGYDLRGLASTGTCPECATPIQESINGLLVNTRPNFVLRLKWASRLAAISLPFLAVNLLKNALTLGYYLWKWNPSLYQWVADRHSYFTWVFQVACIAWWGALWCLTGRQPGVTSPGPTRVLRRFLRSLATFWLMLDIIDWILVNVAWSSLLTPFFSTIVVLEYVLEIGLCALTPRHVQRLGERTTESNLICQARRLRWWVPALATPYFAVGIAASAPGSTFPNINSSAGKASLFVFFLLSIVLLLVARSLICLLLRRLARITASATP